MVNHNDPEFYEVHLDNSERKEKWARLVDLKVIPSRYPDEEALEALGLGDCFWELSRVGGLTKLFKGKWPSHRHLTLEFLSTLEVTKGDYPRRHQIHGIKFRLGNTDHEMSVEEFNAMLGCGGEVVSWPDEFDMDGFWTAITFLSKGKQTPYCEARAKSISIRNPVLRYLQMACAFLPFAREKTKRVAPIELFLLWNILHGRALNMGSFIISHLEMQAAGKSSGVLACGGIVTAIAERCKVHTGELVFRREKDRWELSKDKGEMFLSFEVLKDLEFIMVDDRHRVFFIQKGGGYFPLPNPSYMYVNGWHFTQNWRLNTEAHQEIMDATPVYVPLNPHYRPDTNFWSNQQPMMPEPAQEEHAHDGEGPSEQRRTRRRPRPQHDDYDDDGDDDVLLAERVDLLGIRIDHVEAAMHQHVKQLNQKFDHYHKVNGERWGRVENTLDEMVRGFETFPNPMPRPTSQ
ncbi:uncharacterized protein LOC125201280 [Salvia hispanica]|uniref:uncharacterized protein LOC125201280 n=1 Tax=Salvia hispanica TaxID=49212 RepID=UPI002009779E|nr:uncharacterized protein LOC125201280 [Salvia hispanica]